MKDHSPESSISRIAVRTAQRAWKSAVGSYWPGVSYWLCVHQVTTQNFCRQLAFTAKKAYLLLQVFVVSTSTQDQGTLVLTFLKIIHTSGIRRKWKGRI
jgi:hypothetical protein